MTPEEIIRYAEIGKLVMDSLALSPIDAVVAAAEQYGCKVHVGQDMEMVCYGGPPQEKYFGPVLVRIFGNDGPWTPLAVLAGFRMDDHSWMIEAEDQSEAKRDSLQDSRVPF